MRSHRALSLVLGGMIAGFAGCRQCDVCHNIGGPCGMYSLAGRDFAHTDLPLEGESDDAPLNGDSDTLQPLPTEENKSALDPSLPASAARRAAVHWR